MYLHVPSKHRDCAVDTLIPQIWCISKSSQEFFFSDGGIASSGNLMSHKNPQMPDSKPEAFNGSKFCANQCLIESAAKLQQVIDMGMSPYTGSQMQAALERYFISGTCPGIGTAAGPSCFKGYQQTCSECLLRGTICAPPSISAVLELALHPWDEFWAASAIYSIWGCAKTATPSLIARFSTCFTSAPEVGSPTPGEPWLETPGRRLDKKYRQMEKLGASCIAQPCSAMLSLLFSQGSRWFISDSQIPYLCSCEHGWRMISEPQRFSSNPAMDGFSTKKRAEAEMCSKLDADDTADQAMIPWMDVWFRWSCGMTPDISGCGRLGKPQIMAV